MLFCYGRPLETLWSGGGELLSHKDFFFLLPMCCHENFSSKCRARISFILDKKKKSFLVMQEYFSGLLSAHEIFHSIFLCMNNFFVLKKLLTSCPVRYKIHSLSLWASYCCLSNDPGWGGNKNDSVSISCPINTNGYDSSNWWSIGANGTIGTNRKAPYSNGSVGAYASN